jgi:2'-5' RNA ligase
MRLFVALGLPDPIRSRLESAVHDLRPRIARGPVRFVPPGQWHVTLRFLGEITDTSLVLGRLEAAIRAATVDVPEFTLRLEGFGCFPSAPRPRVLWAGLAGDLVTLTRMQERVAAATEPFAASREDHVFHPHVTLARIHDACRSDADAIRHALERTLLPPTDPWPVREVRLMESRLGSEGARYEIRRAFPLAAAGGSPDSDSAGS